MRRFHIIDASRQTFSAVLNRRRCTISLAYNVTTRRWSMDLSIDGTLMLAGRRLVHDTDLLAPWRFDIGSIFASDWEGKGREPDYDALVNGRTRLLHVTPAEIDAALIEAAA